MISELEKAIEKGQFMLSLRDNFLKNHREEYQISVQYIVSIMSVLGLIAGFGFTAFSSVLSLKLFFFGEMLVVGSILYLILNTKNRLIGQFYDTEKRVNQLIGEIRELKRAILDKNLEKLNRMNSEFSESVNDTSEIPKLAIAENIDHHLSLIIASSSVGIVFIFFSFWIYF